jgi:uncharacterized membrane protein SirB2
MYLVIKHIHIACVVVSISGFFVRGLLTFAHSPQLRHRWIRWAQHFNDSVLLVAAITLVLMSRQYPFVEPWLTAKMFGLITYIVLGSIALSARRSLGLRLGAWLLALAVFAYIVSVALTKNPIALLGIF